MVGLGDYLNLCTKFEYEFFGLRNFYRKILSIYKNSLKRHQLLIFSFIKRARVSLDFNLEF